MSDFDEILGALPIDDLAAALGVSPDEITEASAAAVPALLGGLQANVADPAGADSLAAALGQHDGSVFGAGLSSIDQRDGSKIVDNIFGGSSSDVAAALGGRTSGGQGLVQRLLPILAPIVLAWLSKKLQQSMGGGAGGAMPAPRSDGSDGGLGGGGLGGGGLGDILGQVLGGGSTAGSGRDTGLPTDMGLPGQESSSTSRPTNDSTPAQTQSQNPMGDILGDILGGALGGAQGGAAGGSAQSGGGSIIDLLGGLLGGGRR